SPVRRQGARAPPDEGVDREGGRGARGGRLERDARQRLHRLPRRREPARPPGADRRRQRPAHRAARRGLPGRAPARRRRRAARVLMFLGIDIGTSSSKATLADELGTLVATATRPHTTASPRPGWFEHDAEETWWRDLVALTREVLATVPASAIRAVCVSGIGPCALVADEQGWPLRAAILYGIDSRAEREIEELTDALGAETVIRRTGNRLTTQAVGPKLLWIARHEPGVWARARRWYCASNWLVGRLTGEYVIDHYSGSTSDPLYDLGARDWWPDAWDACAATLDRPRLAWPGDIVGEVHTAAAE